MKTAAIVLVATFIINTIAAAITMIALGAAHSHDPRVPDLDYLASLWITIAVIVTVGGALVLNEIPGGTMNHRTDRILTGIIGLTEGLSSKLPAARNTLLEQRDRIDGYTTTTDATKVAHTTELTPTESAAHRRQLIEIRLHGLNDELDAVVQILRNLHSECNRIIGTRQEVDRCTATGREGAIEWGRPDCWDAPTRGPLCARCYQAERRWRINHGLPTRDEAA